MKNRIKNWFYTGLISMLPIVLTLYFINWICVTVIGFIGDSFIVKYATRHLIELNGITTANLESYVRGVVYILAIGLILISITFVGITLKLVIGRKIAEAVERLFGRLPIIKQIYSTLTQITSLVSSDKTKSYQKVVLIEYPRPGIYSLGFLTSNKNEFFDHVVGREGLLNIFVPTSPNPTSGMFIMLPKEDVTIVNMKIEEAVKLIISGGAIVPERLK